MIKQSLDQALDYLIIDLKAKVGQKPYSKMYVVEYKGRILETRRQEDIIDYANRLRADRVQRPLGPSEKL